ncbi:hypothetical protein E2542_SST17089 [Spatholobus suberectus]|nr:hypothetical protein E2542_SST17089 [Spatholobus suberectus]
MATTTPKRSHAFVTAILTLLCASVCTAKESVYELLPKYGLPSGLLPDTVTDYTLGEDGQFAVVLAKACYVQFDYLVYYESKITGKLSYGSITNLKGIQVQRFFLWLNIDEIRVDLPPSDSIYFQVGIINKKLDVDQFKTVHSCRKSLSPCAPRAIKIRCPLKSETATDLVAKGSNVIEFTLPWVNSEFRILLSLVLRFGPKAFLVSCAVGFLRNFAPSSSYVSQSLPPPRVGCIMLLFIEHPHVRALPSWCDPLRNQFHDDRKPIIAATAPSEPSRGEPIFLIVEICSLKTTLVMLPPRAQQHHCELRERERERGDTGGKKDDVGF